MQSPQLRLAGDDLVVQEGSQSSDGLTTGKSALFLHMISMGQLNPFLAFSYII